MSESESECGCGEECSRELCGDEPCCSRCAHAPGCDDCGERVASASELRQWGETVTGEPWLVCPRCLAPHLALMHVVALSAGAAPVKEGVAIRGGRWLHSVSYDAFEFGDGTWEVCDEGHPILSDLSETDARVVLAFGYDTMAALREMRGAA